VETGESWTPRPGGRRPESATGLFPQLWSHPPARWGRSGRASRWTWAHAIGM